VPVAPVRNPNVHPDCRNVPGRDDSGFEELCHLVVDEEPDTACHLVVDEEPDTALCGQDVTGYPWNPPWPRCEACLAIAAGRQN
jgi:hypothetical protein